MCHYFLRSGLKLIFLITYPAHSLEPAIRYIFFKPLGMETPGMWYAVPVCLFPEQVGRKVLFLLTYNPTESLKMELWEMLIEAKE